MDVVNNRKRYSIISIKVRILNVNKFINSSDDTFSDSPSFDC